MSISIVLTVLTLTVLDNGLTIHDHREVQNLTDMAQCEYLAKAARGDVEDSTAVKMSITTKCEERGNL